MVKIYEYTTSTVNTAQVAVSVGRAYITINFERGQRGVVGQSQSPTYVCRNPIEQIFIEKSELYKKGVIRLKRQYNPVNVEAPKNVIKPAKAAGVKKAVVEEPAGTIKDDAPVIESSENVFPDVTTKAGLTKVLKSKGAKATDLLSDESIVAFIKKAGLEFPNYKF